VSVKLKKSRRRLTPEDRYSQLLNIAIDLNARKGLGRVGHGDIAKLANVSTGTVFNYFSTINILNAAVLESVKTQALNLFTGVSADQDPAAILMFYNQKLHSLVEMNPTLFKLFLNWSQNFDAPFRDEFLSLKADIIHMIVQTLQTREHAEIDALIIYGTGVLYAQMKLEGQPDENLAKFAARVTDLIV